jgi:hypothetical protein
MPKDAKMTYDEWKLETPEDERARRTGIKQVSGECDGCGKYRWLSQTWVGNLETWACDECRGIEPDAYDNGPDPDDARDAWLERQAEDRAHPEWNED